MPTPLSYNASNMRMSAAQLNALKPKLKRAHKQLTTLRESGEQGFFDAPFANTKEIAALAKRAAKQFDTLLVIGIGGSDLGGRTLISALGQDTGMNVQFLSNPDPETIHCTFANLNWKKTAINVISKSGGTLETMSLFAMARKALIDTVGKTNHHKHVIATTDPEHGILHQIATEQGYTMVAHPQNIGGRFAVLTSVGLFPAACAGINIKRLLSGAQWLETAHRKEGIKHISAQFAARHFHHFKQGRDLHVIMPYADRLEHLSKWFRQLWAESLGKDGKGPTPIAAHGAIDQHSQIQLYNGGPDNKVITFIEVETFSKKMRVPKAWSDINQLAYMQGKGAADILHAERRGTASALKKSRKPNGIITLKKITPESIGALLQMYMLATAYMGELMGINTYNQPGVEEGKKIAKRLLGKM